MLKLSRNPANVMLQAEILFEGMNRAFHGQNARIIKRTPISSFHHQLEFVRVALNCDTHEREVDLFVRIYRGQLCWFDVDCCNQPEREWAGWLIAERASLPLAQTLWQGTVHGTAMAIQKRVAHHTLWQARTPQLMSECGKLLANLHRAEVIDSDRIHLADASLPGLLERFTAMAREAEDEFAIEVIRLLSRDSKDESERPATLVHGDWHPGNVLTDGRRLTAILDWEDSAYGDPRLDLATMDVFLRGNLNLASRFRRRNLKRLADTFQDAYSESAGWKVGSLSFWKRLLDAGTVVISTWLRHRSERGLSYPRTDLRVWLRYNRGPRKRLIGWMNSN